MLYTIYRVTHLESGKCYIGKHQTIDPNDGYMGSGHLIKSAIKKHGVEGFRKEVLHIFETEQEMNAKEAELVTEEFCSREDTYNLCPGGNGGFGFIRSLPGYKDQTSRGGSTTQRKRLEDPELDAKLKAAASNTFKRLRASGWKPKPSKSFLGKRHSEEWKKNHSELMKIKSAGKNNPSYGTIWITDGTINRKQPASEPISDGWRRGRSMGC